MQAWFCLAAAICLEVAGTTSMKLSNGFERLLPSVLIVLFYGLSFTALTFALRRLDISMAYAIWAGLGTALIAVIGMAFFREPLTLLKLGSLLLIILGVVGLHLSGVKQGG
jgi:small multidrug resistance pump